MPDPDDPGGDPALQRLLGDIRACRICVERPYARPMPHEPRPVVVGSSTARVLVAGQAPGTRVHASGIPFDDRSGDRLRDWMGVTRAQFYDPALFAIAPMGFCFPGHDGKGGDLPPRAECAPAWRAELMAHMPQIELVLVIGQYALAWHLSGHLAGRRRRTLTETVRDWRGLLDTSERPRVLPLPHPSWRNTAWLKRNPWFEAELVPVLRREIRARI